MFVDAHREEFRLVSLAKKVLQQRIFLCPSMNLMAMRASHLVTFILAGFEGVFICHHAGAEFLFCDWAHNNDVFHFGLGLILLGSLEVGHITRTEATLNRPDVFSPLARAPAATFPPRLHFAALPRVRRSTRHALCRALPERFP